MIKDTSDYCEFINKVSKVWKPENNRALSLEYGLNRAVLPSLVKLNRVWNDIFNDLDKENEDLRLKLNHYQTQDIDKLLEENKKLSKLLEENKKLSNRIKVLKDNLASLEQKHTLLLVDFQNLSNKKVKKKSFFGV